MNDIVVYNLRETYHELGVYEFKVVLDPKLYKSSHASEAIMLDSDGNQMSFKLNKWGRKMNFTMKIDERVPDGVSVVRLNLVRDDGTRINQMLSFWIIKP